MAVRNRLWGMKTYLIGAMDRVPDGGVVWRDRITPPLEELGVVVLNPCDKPIDIGLEDIEKREYRESLKEHGQYDQLAAEVKQLRVVDLRMVDMADFVIMNVDTSVHMCGSYEEDSWANRCKDPVLVRCEQGKVGCPDWMFGKIPHLHIFSEWEELLDYLRHVDADENVNHMKRWMFFDYTRMMPKVPPRFDPDWRPW
jgi:hypothetical protein